MAKKKRGTNDILTEIAVMQQRLTTINAVIAVYASQEGKAAERKASNAAVEACNLSCDISILQREFRLMLQNAYSLMVQGSGKDMMDA